MAKNEFLPFGIAEGANVLSNQEYERLAARFNGFVSGVAKSKELNTVWRQSSVMSSVLAQFIVDSDNKDLLDNGDVAGIKNRLIAAIKQTISGVGYVTTSAMNLELNKKMDKANISGVKGKDNDKVPSLNLFTTETGKLATKGELTEGLAGKQPVGDYATNQALNQALTNKRDLTNNAFPSFAYQPSDSTSSIWCFLDEMGSIGFAVTKNGKTAFLRLSELNTGTVATVENITKSLESYVKSEDFSTELAKKRGLDNSIFKTFSFNPYDTDKNNLWFFSSEEPDWQQGIARNGVGQTGYSNFRSNHSGDVAHTNELFGFKQKWVDVTATRNQGVTYTNTSPVTIFVAISDIHSAKGDGDYVGFGFVVDGLTLYEGVATTHHWLDSLSIPIPPGASYSFNADPTQIKYLKWSEFIL